MLHSLGLIWQKYFPTGHIILKIQSVTFTGPNMTTVFANKSHYRVLHGNPDKGKDFVPWVKQFKSPIKEGLKCFF